jgi:hypothetical protein
MNTQQMSKRERVEATLNLQETDRTPVYDLMFNDACIKYFAGVEAPYGEEGVKIKCKAIGKTLDMTRAADGGPAVPGCYTDEDGFVSTLDRWFNLGYKNKPFNDESGAIHWLKKSNNRLATELKNIDVNETAKIIRERFITVQNYIGDDTVVLIRDSGTGLDHVRQKLGLQIFSYINYDEPELISEYMELFTQIEVKLIHAYADVKLSPCAMTFGDIAMKNALMHSPQWLRKEFFPRLKRLNDAYHEHNIKCLFHSDGNVMEVMDDLIASGIDGLNPIETVAGMNLSEVNRLYGDKIFFAGGIDMSQLLSYGTPEEVYKVSKEAIKTASPGYFIGSTTELDNSSRLENIFAMLNAVGVSTKTHDIC